MRNLKVAVLIILFCSLSMQAQEVLLKISDPKGDDYGGGSLNYPEHPVYLEGLFDLENFQVSHDEYAVYFDFKFATVTNPFGAPEGYFHQRIEVLFDTGSDAGEQRLKLGGSDFRAGPDFGWDLRLAVAPFQESVLYQCRANQLVILTDDLETELLSDGKTIRLKIQKEHLPEINANWRYSVLVGSFDGLAKDSWRGIGEGVWQPSGDGPPIFDILAPRFGKASQKNQLIKGVLYPVQPAQFRFVWLWVFFIPISFFVWRWIYGRTKNG